MACECGCGLELKKADLIRIVLQGEMIEQSNPWGSSTLTLVPQVNPFAIAEHVLADCYLKKIKAKLPSPPSKQNKIDELKEAMTDLHCTHPAIVQEIYVYMHRVLGCRI